MLIDIAAVVIGVILAVAVALAIRRPREPVTPGMSPEQKQAYIKRNTLVGRHPKWVAAFAALIVVVLVAEVVSRHSH